MSAGTSGSLTTTGSITLNPKSPSDMTVHVAISGTYGTVTFVFEGTVDGTNWFPLVAALMGDGTLVNGSIAPADNAIKAYVVRGEYCSQLRLRTTLVTSGQLDVVMTPGNLVGPLLQVSQNTSAASYSVNALTGTSVAVTAGLTSSGATGAGIGYATGAGGAVTQATNRATGVTVSKLSGAITTNNASLAALATATFTVTNTAVAIGDVVIVSIRSGATNTNTTVSVTAVAAGSFNISIVNGGGAAQSTAETGAIIINYAVIKAVSA